MSSRPKKPVNFYEQGYLDEVTPKADQKKPGPKEKEMVKNIPPPIDPKQKDLRKAKDEKKESFTSKQAFPLPPQKEEMVVNNTPLVKPMTISER